MFIIIIIIIIIISSSISIHRYLHLFYSHRNVLCRLQCDSADGFVRTMIILKRINGVLNVATVSSMNNRTCVLYVCWHAVLAGPLAYMQRGWLIIEESWLRTLQGDVDVFLLGSSSRRPNVPALLMCRRRGRLQAAPQTHDHEEQLCMCTCMHVCMWCVEVSHSSRSDTSSSSAVVHNMFSYCRRKIPTL